MAFSIPRFSPFATISPSAWKNPSNIQHSFISFPALGNRRTSFGCRCAAAKQQKSGAPPATKKKKKTSTRNNSETWVEDDFVIEKGGGGGGVEVLESPSQLARSPLQLARSSLSELPLPKPLAGFVLDDQGRVLMASKKRIATIVDSANNLPLDCVIRRIFTNSRGDECMLLCPLDMPIQILKSVNVEGWCDVSDEEVDAILPNVDYALAKMHMHLVYSGFCYTARGGFAYGEEDIFEFPIDDKDTDGMPVEGIEIGCFHLDGSHYMIYTPAEPLLFVAMKDKNSVLQMVGDDEILDDPAIIRAIDEETEFNALVEEEEALLDSLIGKS